MLKIVIFVNRKENFNFDANNKNVNFPAQFCFKIISNWFNDIESREVSLNGNMHDVSFDYNSVDKSDILSIHKYLMIKNNIKQCPALLSKYLSYYWGLVPL